MPITNYYNGLNVSGSTLTDLVGGVNGTLVSSPAVRNGYINFVRSSSQRIDFASGFDYTYNATFSHLIFYRSSKLDSNYHSLFMNSKVSNTLQLTYLITDLERVRSFHRPKTGESRLVQPTTANTCDGKFRTYITTHDTTNDNGMLDDYISTPVTTSQTSGNFYDVNTKRSLGAEFSSGTTYSNYLSGDIQLFIAFNHKLTSAEQKNYVSYNKGFFN